MSKKIIFIIGSLRKNSFNRQMAKETKNLIGDRAEVEFLEYEDIPFMNQDIEFPTPNAVNSVRNIVKGADGIWIFTPEYNHQIPGVLKNLLDWLSRPIDSKNFSAGTAVSGKAVTISGAGGKNQTKGCRENLDVLLEFMKMSVMKDKETGVSLPQEAFMSGNFEISNEIRNQLLEQANAFLDFIC